MTEKTVTVRQTASPIGGLKINGQPLWALALIGSAAPRSWSIRQRRAA